MGQMSLTRDARAPVALTQRQIEAALGNPKILQPTKRRDDSRRALKAQGGIKKGTEAARQHAALNAALQREKVYQRKMALKEVREQFFATVDTLEVESQLHGTAGDRTSTDLMPQFNLPDRAALATLLFYDAKCDTAQEAFARRIKSLEHMVALCSCRESPRTRNADEKAPSNRSSPITTTFNGMPYEVDPAKYPLVLSGF